MSDEKISEKVVAITDGPEYGYAGTVQDDTPNEAYTVAGVTKADDDQGDTQDDEPKQARTSRPKRSS
jgi:hypothetical protein